MLRRMSDVVVACIMIVFCCRPLCPPFMPDSNTYRQTQKVSTPENCLPTLVEWGVLDKIKADRCPYRVHLIPMVRIQLWAPAAAAIPPVAHIIPTNISWTAPPPPPITHPDVISTTNPCLKFAKPNHKVFVHVAAPATAVALLIIKDLSLWQLC